MLPLMNPAAGAATPTGIAVPLDHELCTRYCTVLLSTVAPVVTVTNPVLAPAGTTAERYVVPVRVTAVAGTPLNATTEELLNPWPRIPTVVPTFPEEGNRPTNGGRLAFKLK